ncbi:MAG: DUF4280 domain-containing protein [Nitrospina sp.]|nr:DUF4280 domain-containing protein [Nitrospina sp.]
MAYLVCDGATISCSGEVSQGTCSLTVLNSMITSDDNAQATIMDYVPYMNVASFGSCNLSSNPMVAAATAAKLGVHTPVTCVPMTLSPWLVGSPTVMVNNLPALTDDSTLICTWGGTISVDDAGQSVVET